MNEGAAVFVAAGILCSRLAGLVRLQVFAHYFGLESAAADAAAPLDADEPRHLAEAVSQLGLEYLVVTSVDRDDLPDAGSGHFAEAIRELLAKSPETKLEVLIPDFRGNWDALDVVLDARPDVLNHNTETVPRLYRTARPGGRYPRTLELLDGGATVPFIVRYRKEATGGLDDAAIQKVADQAERVLPDNTTCSTGTSARSSTVVSSSRSAENAVVLSTMAGRRASISAPSGASTAGSFRLPSATGTGDRPCRSSAAISASIGAMSPAIRLAR